MPFAPPVMTAVLPWCPFAILSPGEWRIANSAILLLAMEEMPILSVEERKKLLNSLKEAQARINAGDALDFDPATFKKRLIKIYRQGIFES
jgi:hypothetical protein